MIRVAATLDDFARCASITNAVEPVVRVTAEELERRRDGRFLLHTGGGYAFVTRSSVPGSAFAMVRVLPDQRRRGIGSELLVAARDDALALEADSMWGRVRENDADSRRFVSRRGFEEVGREVELVRELRPGEGEIPAGVVELRPEHRRAAYAVAVECLPDMPQHRRAEARGYEAWLEQDLAGPVAFVALQGEDVVGYAALLELPATPGRLEHGFTAVRRSHRGRGIGTALQRAEIAWAAARGYEQLVTSTHELNAPMRAVKAKLGYVERSLAIHVRRALS